MEHSFVKCRNGRLFGLTGRRRVWDGRLPFLPTIGAVMHKRWIAAACLLAPLALPGGAAAQPPLCTADAIQDTLVAAGKLTPEAIELGVVVDLVRCGDVTKDGDTDALFTLASGGTAGDTRFGVLRGTSDGSAPQLVLFKQGYKIGIARRNRRSFEIIQPHYKAGEPNCCPSSFRKRRYTWRGDHFKAGKARKLKHAPAKFYRS